MARLFPSQDSLNLEITFGTLKRSKDRRGLTHLDFHDLPIVFSPIPLLYQLAISLFSHVELYRGHEHIAFCELYQFHFTYLIAYSFNSWISSKAKCCLVLQLFWLVRFLLPSWWCATSYSYITTVHNPKPYTASLPAQAPRHSLVFQGLFG